MLFLLIIFVLLFGGIYFYTQEKRELDRVCSLEARAGLIITLLDESGDKIIGAQIIDESTDTPFDEFNGVYMGLYEADGNQSFKIIADGYRPFSDSVSVTKTDCHVDTVKKEITLKK